MTYTVVETDSWKPKLSEHDASHLIALGLRASTLKGHPSLAHLKHPGEAAALCGKEPGVGNARRMVNRVGWYVFANIEGRGRDLCEPCMKAAERIDRASAGEAQS